MRRWNLREVSLPYVLGPWVNGRQTALTPFQWTLVLRHNYYLSSSVSVSSSPLHLSCANVTVLVWQFGLPEQKTDCWKTSGFPDLKKGRKKKKRTQKNTKREIISQITSSTRLTTQPPPQCLSSWEWGQGSPDGAWLKLIAEEGTALSVPPYISCGFRPREGTALQKPHSYTYRWKKCLFQLEELGLSIARMTVQ